MLLGRWYALLTLLTVWFSDSRNDRVGVAADLSTGYYAARKGGEN